VANAMRLLKLPEDVLGLVEDGQLSEGHGRAILQAPTVAEMQKLARQAVAGSWSVRETERRARAANGAAKKAKKADNERSANVRDLEQRLSHSLGSTVQLRDRRGKGRIEISYSSFDELDRLLEKLL